MSELRPRGRLRDGDHLEQERAALSALHPDAGVHHHDRAHRHRDEKRGEIPGRDVTTDVPGRLLALREVSLVSMISAAERVAMAEDAVRLLPPDGPT